MELKLRHQTVDRIFSILWL